MEILTALLPVLLIGIMLFFPLIMLFHLIQNDVQNKALWIVILILGGIIGAFAYYFIVYIKTAQKTGAGINSRIVLGAGIGAVIIVPLLFFLSIPRQAVLKHVPISEVIRQSNNGDIQKIEITGDELKITLKGEPKPTERSRKESGSSIYEQGLSKDVQVEIKK